MSEAAMGRQRRGEWKPPGLLTTPPLFVWPPRPVALLGWLFRWNGYLFPFNTLYALISIATWRWLTPPLEQMAQVEAWWIGVLLARNAALLTLLTGSWHLFLYSRKSQGTEYKFNPRWLATNNKTFMFGDQLLDNLVWTFASAVPIWTAFEAVTYYGQANGWFPYVDWATHPVWCTVLLLLVPLWREFHFYCIHRLIHWPPLYRTVHHLHHKNVNVGPWSGMAMHPVEHVLYFSAVCLHWIVPSSPLHALYNLQHLAFAPGPGHSGFEKVVLAGGVAQKVGTYMHYLHHKYFEVNYGGDGSIPFDKWFGTYHDGSAEAEERMNRRVLARGRKG